MIDDDVLFLTNVVEKRCARCGEMRTIGQFYRKRDSKDGFQSYCADCQSEYKMIRTVESHMKSANLGNIKLNEVLAATAGWPQKDKTDLSNYLISIATKLKRNKTK